MLAFIPSALLLLASLAGFILQRLKQSVGYTWMICAAASLFSLAMAVFLRWRLPQLVALEGWLPFSQFTDSPIYGLDGISWPFLFSLAAVCAGSILTSSARLVRGIDPNAWLAVLALTAVGMLAVLSANLLTFILTWTLIDLLELAILQTAGSEKMINLHTVQAFAVRVTGTVLAMVATLVSRGQGLPPTFTEMPPANAVLVLLAVGMRLGVLPVDLPSTQAGVASRGLGLALRYVTAASALVALARLPADSLSSAVGSILLPLCSLATLYAAMVWVGAGDEIHGRTYWLIGASGLAVASALQGRPEATLAWGIAMILPGASLFLFSARRRGLLILPALGLISFSGLPFTLAASGWSGIFTAPFSFWQILLLAAHALLMVGFARFMLLPGDDLSDMERWVQAAHPLGMAFLVAASLMAGLMGWRGSFSAGIGWAGIASAALAAAFWLGLSLYRRRTAQDTAINRWYVSTLRKIGSFISSVISFNWLYRLIWLGYRRLAEVIRLLTEILEGDGGVLWAMVLLALVVSLLQARLAR